ncbi:hypothetical protein [Nonomuraea sediminis]|uniref:hypothetical protein n=1 Tax=Nonomuraea sediminis TaxID=2835864 RepID=UPI001BDC48D0|nr:hypothetical protein [Nonomuraea sediminis]
MDNLKRSHRRRLVADLRRFAEFVESRPDVPAPRDVTISVHPRYAGDETTTEADAIAAVEQIAAALHTPLDVQDGHVTATLTFGLVTFKVVVITADAMARHRAWWSYQDAVRPDTDEAV